MRRPKPYFRKQTQTWYVQLGKKQVNLGKDEAKAFDQYHQLMAKREAFEVVDDSVYNVMNRYLIWLKENRSEGTYDLRRRYLRKFAKYIGKSKRMSQLKKHHVQSWVEQDYAGKAKSQNNCITSLNVAFNWAVELEYIDRNPIARMKKPADKSREFFLKPAEWKLVLNEIKSKQFADIVAFMLFTGARPQEAIPMNGLKESLQCSWCDSLFQGDCFDILASDVRKQAANISGQQTSSLLAVETVCKKRQKLSKHLSKRCDLLKRHCGDLPWFRCETSAHGESSFFYDRVNGNNIQPRKNLTKKVPDKLALSS